MRSVVLKKNGIFIIDVDRNGKKTQRKCCQCNDILDALFLPFFIEGKVTLKSLVDILRDFDTDEILMLEKVSDAHILPYLFDVWDHPLEKKKNSDLKRIEVYGTFEIDNFDGCNDTYDIQLHWSAHGIGKPYDKKNPEANMWAIEFTPWQNMLHLPLTIRENLFYTEHTWKKLKKSHEFKVDVLGQKKKHSFGFIDRKLTNPFFKSKRTFKRQPTFTEFFQGLFDELCFFGSPATREDEKKTLTDRSAEVDEFLKKKKK